MNLEQRIARAEAQMAYHEQQFNAHQEQMALHNLEGSRWGARLMELREMRDEQDGALGMDDDSARIP